MSEEELILKKIKEINPEYEGTARGRGRIKQINEIPRDKRKEFLFYESKLKLLNNKIAAKKNRRKNKLHLENLEEEVTKLERKIKIQEKEIKNLRNKIILLKTKNKKSNNFLNTTQSNPPPLPTLSSPPLQYNPPSTLISSPLNESLYPSFEEIINFDEIDYSLDLKIF